MRVKQKVGLCCCVVGHTNVCETTHKPHTLLAACAVLACSTPQRTAAAIAMNHPIHIQPHQGTRKTHHRPQWRPAAALVDCLRWCLRRCCLRCLLPGRLLLLPHHQHPGRARTVLVLVLVAAVESHATCLLVWRDRNSRVEQTVQSDTWHSTQRGRDSP